VNSQFNAEKVYTGARIQLATAVLQAGGWSIGQQSPENMVAGSIYFYVFNAQTHWCWMCSIPKESFYLAVDRLPDTGTEHSAAANGVAHLSRLAAAGKGPDGWEDNLALLLTAYIVPTKTFKLADQGRSAPHFPVITYPKSSMIRPVALPGSDRFALPVPDIVKAAQFTIEYDRRNRPEWVGD
jgi:hypothetical protein